MKYLISGVALLAILLTFCVVNYYVVSGDLNEILGLLDTAETAYLNGDNQTALTSSAAALALWHEKRTYMSSVITHGHVDIIEEHLVLAARGVENGIESVKDAIIDAKSVIMMVIKDEMFTFGNIM